jgi:hypothetical protein
MAHSAIMSVRITGNSDDAVKAFQKATSKAAAFGSFMGGAALKGVTALWDKLKDFGGAVIDMSDSTDKFVQTMNFAGIDTSNVEKASQAARDYADRTVYDLSTIQNTTAQLAANGISDYTGLTEAAGNLNAVAGGNADDAHPDGWRGQAHDRELEPVGRRHPRRFGQTPGSHAQERRVHGQFPRRHGQGRNHRRRVQQGHHGLGHERRRQGSRIEHEDHGRRVR